MSTYFVLLATLQGSIKTVLVDKESYEGDPAAYFRHGATDVGNHGEVEISGPAEDMVPDIVGDD